MLADKKYVTLLFHSISEMTDFAVEASLYFHQIDENRKAVNAPLSESQIARAINRYHAKLESAFVAEVV